MESPASPFATHPVRLIRVHSSAKVTAEFQLPSACSEMPPGHVQSLCSTLPPFAAIFLKWIPQVVILRVTSHPLVASKRQLAQSRAVYDSLAGSSAHFNSGWSLNFLEADCDFLLPQRKICISRR